MELTIMVKATASPEVFEDYIATVTTGATEQY